MQSALDAVGQLADAELVCGLERLVKADRAMSAKLLVHLGEVDARGLFRDEAYPSMHEYAVKTLRMSDAEAFFRINAARVARRFPLVVTLLGRGELPLTAIKLLGPHLTDGNHVQVLERARGKSKREVELLIAEIAPRPDVQEHVRKVRGRNVRVAQTSETPNALDLAPAVLPSTKGPRLHRRQRVSGPQRHPS